MTEHTIEQLLAEIADSAAREADFRNRAEVAEAKVAQLNEHIDRNRHYREVVEGLPVGTLGDGDEIINPEVYRIEDGHPYEESAWPSLRETHKCHLCGSLEEFHMPWKS